MSVRCFRRPLALLLTLVWLLTACGCVTAPEGEGEETLFWETFPKETFLEAEEVSLSVQAERRLSEFPSGSVVGDWLTLCGGEDRDEQFEVYSLRRETPAEGGTSFTYVIYYPHGGTALTPALQVLRGEGGYVLQLTYESGGIVEGYSLCVFTVLLPTTEAPRLRLLHEGEALGQLTTVTAENIDG